MKAALKMFAMSLVVFVALVGCSKKEEAPAPQAPAVQAPIVQAPAADAQAPIIQSPAAATANTPAQQ